MKNLLTETISILERGSKTIRDIRWVGTTNYYISIERFLDLANVNYDSGFGGQEVAVNLLVVGDDWWLERHEYDGSEWWEFKTLPTLPTRSMDVTALTRDQISDKKYYYENPLEGMNGVKD